ncbi:heterokaryon incompatibility protein-domain-containing protein [Plectosphaerella plurivora]|uniref:Heterokaryon incompatibility protein-domain-containing protein n=1 Tax=Plectosphaerella plurivora TaxID=936078 RepID=A0A9P8V668_9PEZI|nr:heterokaryon incompatibility protein-domain-containing protein [Plectosphaerella plurivora]
MAALVFWSVLGCQHLIAKQRDKRVYKYGNLNSTRRETRLLTLEPGSFLDELQGDVHTISIDDPPTSRARYEAVSYVWGSSASKPDFVRIGSSGRRLWIPYNLGQTLRYLRLKQRPRALWIDFVSINQEDHVDKARQVAMMGDIYRAADRVVVWLGPAANESNMAISLLEDLGSMVEFDFVNNRMRPSPAGAIDISWADPTEYLPYEQDELWSIYELVHRAWFGRVWSRQEIAVANPATAIFVCGHKTISWNLLRTALATIANKPRHYLDRSHDSSPELRFARRYDLVLLLCQPLREHSFLDLLDQGRKFNCADPRDRVFAIRSMAADVDRSFGTNVKVDYTHTMTQVYQDVLLRYVEHSKSTNILASCENTGGKLVMPSWVPDWTRKRVANPMPMFLASSMSEANVRHNGSELLRASSVRCATVVTTSELFGDFVPVMDVIAAIRRCAPPDALTAAYRGEPGGMIRAYCTTLAWGLFESLHEPPLETYPDINTSIESLRLILEQTENEDESTKGRSSTSYDYATLTYVTHLLASCKGRAFFTTKEGYVGIGPRTMRPGDTVDVLLGCDVPLILRERLDSKTEIIGDSYVHGLMSGEAMLGPLPEGCRVVIQGGGDEPGHMVFAYGEGDEMIRSVEDPRVSRFRRRVLDADTTGEKRKGSPMVLEDLLTPENLHAAGVPVIHVNIG